jgi:putative nucleotidyltransferase with HDIG domain
MKISLRSFLYTLIGLAIILTIYVFNIYPFRARLSDLLMFLALGLILEAFPVEIPGQQMAISMGFVISYAGILLFGAPFGILMTGLASISPEEINFKLHPPRHFIFNRATLIICGAISGLLFEVLNGPRIPFGWYYLLISLAPAIVYWLVNVTLLSIVIAIDKGRPIVNTWIYYVSNISIITYLLHFVLAVLIAQSYKFLGPIIIIIYMVPIFIARYLFILTGELNKTYDQAISTLIKLLGIFDNYTSSHSLRVAQISEDIARELGLSEARIEKIRNAALLHDLGKIGLPISILNNSRPLTQEEWQLIYKHPETGEDISKEVSRFKEVPKWIRYHHERYNGDGYPERLKSNEIPLESRIIACADTFDAITTDRPYSRRKNIEEAKEEILRASGNQLDPMVVQALIKVIEKNSSIYSKDSFRENNINS